MRFYADSHCVPGLLHRHTAKPCQDYTVHQAAKDGAFGVVSDGCSTGGRTDVGARVVALTTAGLLPLLPRAGTSHEISWIRLCRLWRLLAAQRTLGLTEADLLATCGFALLSETGGVIHVDGDGVIAIRFRDRPLMTSRVMEFTRLTWAHNMPCYPIYERDDYAAFLAAHGDSGFAFGITDGLVTDDEPGLWQSAEHAVRGYTLPIVASQVQEIGYVAVFSDGVCQVDGLDWRTSVRQLLDFKSSTGEFVKRRLTRFVQDSLKVGKGPLDDLSMAVIRIEHEESDGESAHP